MVMGSGLMSEEVRLVHRSVRTRSYESVLVLAVALRTYLLTFTCAITESTANKRTPGEIVIKDSGSVCSSYDERRTKL